MGFMFPHTQMTFVKRRVVKEKSVVDLSLLTRKEIKWLSPGHPHPKTGWEPGIYGVCIPVREVEKVKKERVVGFPFRYSR